VDAGNGLPNRAFTIHLGKYEILIKQNIVSDEQATYPES
jgi:hypothetical protein